MVEIIPIPEEKAKDARPIDVEVPTSEAWPGERLRVLFDWNNAIGHWIFEMRHVGYGKMFPRSPAQLVYPYRYRDYLLATFINPSGRAEKITPENLGDGVSLAIFAGPDSPGWQEDGEEIDEI